MERLSGLAACTVVSKNHLAYARVLHESFTRHHPGARFFVLLADRVEGDFAPKREPFELIELERLEIPDLPRFCFQYDVLELNCAAKPYLMRHVLAQAGVSKLLYLDSDTFVYRELAEALDLLDRHSIVLTPHLVAPAAEDGRKPGERHIMESGVYNAGFLGLRNDADTMRFLEWWSDRIYDKCIRDTRQGLFVDQRWLDLVPGLFEGVHVLRNPAYNVGHWGLTHRRVEAGQGGPSVNGQPLAFFHFSGLDVDRPEAISQHQDRFSLADVPALEPLFRDYVNRVKAAGHAECQRWPYAYARFGNGVPITHHARRLYWSLGDDVRRFGDPFVTRGDGSFWAWMREDARPRVPSVAAQPSGADASAAGVPGVNVTRPEGASTDELKVLVGALAAAGIPYRFVEPGGDNAHPVNILPVPAADLPRFVRDRGPGFFRGKYNVACWLEEQSPLPEAFRGAFAYVDEVWVSGRSSLETVTRVSPVPVIDLRLDGPAAAVGGRIRERLSLVGREPSGPGSVFRE